MWHSRCRRIPVRRAPWARREEFVLRAQPGLRNGRSYYSFGFIRENAFVNASPTPALIQSWSTPTNA
jgi:hypothetical protein